MCCPWKTTSGVVWNWFENNLEWRSGTFTEQMYEYEFIFLYAAGLLSFQLVYSLKKSENNDTAEPYPIHTHCISHQNQYTHANLVTDECQLLHDMKYIQKEHVFDYL